MQKSGVAIFDLDRTITTQGTYTPFIVGVAMRRPWTFAWLPKILISTIFYRFNWISRGRLKEIMLHAVLGGQHQRVAHSYAEEFVRRWLASKVRPGALAAIEKHKLDGHELVLATAAFRFYAEIFADALGFDAVVATEVERDASDCLTGRIEGVNCYGSAKLAAINAWRPNLQATCEIWAYTDHHTDAPLLLFANQGFAINPNEKLLTIAKQHQLEIMDWGAP